MAELERLASTSDSSKDDQTGEMDTTRRSITSSALTSLLPIAAASGIVQPNYNTPKISFYSPSGNLIQPEASSSPDAYSPPSIPSTAGTSHRRSSKKNPTSRPYGTAYLPPSRPHLVPMTTPPTTVAPLPYHIRHHHNYQHIERSIISSCESLIDPSPSIKGCGGIVRTPDLTPRSGIIETSPRRIRYDAQQNQRQSLRSHLHDLHSDAGFYKSRYIALAAQAIGPSSQKKSKKNYPKPLHKRHMTSKRPAAPKHCMTVARKRSSPEQKRKSAVGPLAGHALRICFCQPYDGAGNRTRADTSCTRRHADGTHGVEHEDGDLQDEHEDAVRPVSRPRREKEAGRRSATGRSQGRIGNQRVVLK